MSHHSPHHVTACLRNGCSEAAEFLAQNGTPLDPEGAAGVGRLDLVQKCIKQLQDGLAWASMFGQTEVVGYLLDHGFTSDITFHCAACGGHVDLVRLLLKRGADPSVPDKQYAAIPAAWALHAKANNPANKPWDKVIELLRAARQFTDVSH